MGQTAKEQVYKRRNVVQQRNVHTGQTGHLGHYVLGLVAVLENEIVGGNV